MHRLCNSRCIFYILKFRLDNAILQVYASIYKYCRYVKISRKCHPQKIWYVYIACNAIYFTESEYHYPYQNKQKHYIRRSKPQQLKVHEYYAPQEIHYQLNPVYRQQFSFHTHRRITVMYQMRRYPHYRIQYHPHHREHPRRRHQRRFVILLEEFIKTACKQSR